MEQRPRTFRSARPALTLPSPTQNLSTIASSAQLAHTVMDQLTSPRLPLASKIVLRATTVLQALPSVISSHASQATLTQI